MGKASKLKKIRAIAAKLPAVQRYTKEIHVVQGSDLIKEWGSNISPLGATIIPEKKYKVDMPVIAEINHNRRMKKFYNEYGIAGVKGYAQVVMQHDAKNKLANV